MEGLTRPEYESLLALTESVLTAETALVWWKVFTDVALGPLFHADVVAVASIDHGPRVTDSVGTFAIIEPAWARESVPAGSPMHQDLLGDHPMSDHLRSAAAQETVRLSDLVTPQRWRQMAGYSKMKELIGATHQIGITVSGGHGHFLAATPIRAASDFTAHELHVAQRTGPLLGAADRHTRTRTQQRAGCTDAELAVADSASADLGVTERQRVVLGLLSQGLTAQGIAHHLGVSVRTVAKHQENLYRKLGVSDRLRAVLLARNLGLLP